MYIKKVLGIYCLIKIFCGYHCGINLKSSRKKKVKTKYSNTIQ